jgi:hypothetical protein
MKMPALTKGNVLAAVNTEGGLEKMLDREIAFYGSLHCPGDLAHATLVERQDEMAKVAMRVPNAEAAAVLYRRGLASLRWAAFQQVDSDKGCWDIHASEGQLSFLVVGRTSGECRIRLPKGAVNCVATYAHAIEGATGRFCVPVLRWTGDEAASDSRHWS